ncbi:MAG: DCC1-like thiol-disulfide oxidoreductase family protein [Woeseiaceae bacterium]|nr:DCC1-like thiol-disulfide oxidoreductase family protein [Woeseiaceae bacterium]
MAANDDIQLVYDRECPVCEYYCQRVDVDASAGRLVRIDAREPSEVMDEITALGLDIDEGMVVKIDDRIYYGSDAIHELAKLSAGPGVVNRLSRLTFRTPAMARFFYPMLKAVRNLLLKLLGRSRINNLDQSNNDWF